MQNGGSDNRQHSGSDSVPRWREEIDAPGSLGSDETFDKAAAWENLSRRQRHRKPAGKKYSRYAPSRRVAAAVLLVMSAALVYLLMDKRSNGLVRADGRTNAQTVRQTNGQNAATGREFPDPVISPSVSRTEIPAGHAATPARRIIAGGARNRKNDPRRVMPAPATIAPPVSPAQPAIVIDVVAMSEQLSDPLKAKKEKWFTLMKSAHPGSYSICRRTKTSAG